MELICQNTDSAKIPRCTCLAPSLYVTFPLSTCINLSNPYLFSIKVTPCLPRNLIQSVHIFSLQSTTSPLRSFRKTFVQLVSPLIPKLSALAKWLQHPGQVRSSESLDLLPCCFKEHCLGGSLLGITLHWLRDFLPLPRP